MPATTHTIVITPHANQPFGYECNGFLASSWTVNPNDWIVWELAPPFATIRPLPKGRKSPAFVIIFTSQSPFENGEIVIAANPGKKTVKLKVKKLLRRGFARCPYKVVVAVGTSAIWIDDPEIQVDCYDT